MSWKLFLKLYGSFLRKLRNKFYNLTYCSLLQPLVIYNFSEIESTFLALFWDCVANCRWRFGMVSICLIKEGKYDWFLHKGLLFDWLISLLYLQQSVCFSIYSAKTTFLHFLHPFVPKPLRTFVTVMRPKFHCLLRFSTRWT